MFHQYTVHTRRVPEASSGVVLALTIILSLSATAQTATSHAAITPVNLRVSSLVNPVGLDSSRPQFSWTLDAADSKARNLSQSSYRIVVASSPAMLATDKADIWDSGRVASGEFLHVRYAGPPLLSHTTYFWKVCVWDQAGADSAWTKPAFWTTALHDPSEWSAKWIAAHPDSPPTPQIRESDEMPLADSVNPLPIFRHDFHIDKPVKQAIIFVTGLGEYELTLNGNSVTETVLNPGWTNYRKTVIYQTYVVTTLLRHGGNCFGVMLGGGMYDVPGVKGRYSKFVGSFGQPKLILQMHVLYADGTTAKIVSDTSWKTTPGPVVFSSIYGGEDYDASKEPPGWNKPGFDDSSWVAALEVAAPNGVTSGTGEELSGRMIPAMHVAEAIEPSKITGPKHGTQVYDFGQNFSGWPCITIRGHRGDTVKLISGELLDAQGMVTQVSAAAGPDHAVLFTYTLRGDEHAEVWHPRFSYYGFRYVQVETTSKSRRPGDEPVLLSMQGDVVHDDVERTGEFSSSLPLFDGIHRLIDNAILSNLASVLTDCPTREKLGWLEQTHLMGTSVMENFDVLKLYQKLADDMTDSQLPTGLVPSIAPEFVAFVDSEGRSTNFRDSPEWGSAIILSPWAAYQFYGDKGLLADHYEAMTRYAEYLRRKSADHILQYGLGDWYDVGPEEPGESQFTDKGVTATAIYYQDLQALVQIATLLGKDRDAMDFLEEASSVKDAFNRRFLHPETNEYDRGSQTANAMSLVLGLVPEDRRARVLEHLVEDIRNHANHVTAGDIGFHYVVRALTNEGRSAVLFDMLSRTDSPSYGYQLVQGATTLTEAWDANPKSSQNHFMLGHAEEWFYRGLAGIDLDLSRPAPRQIIIRPALLKEAQGASATVHSVLGTIRVSWLYNSTWSLDVEIPPGSSATLYLPDQRGEIMENSTPLDSASFGQPPEEVGGMTVIVLGSGTYHFVGVPHPSAGYSSAIPPAK